MANEWDRKRMKNAHKRVKLHSKRMRAHWYKITAWLDAPSVVALSATCHRLDTSMHEDDRIWQACYERYRAQLIPMIMDSEKHVAASDAYKQRLQQLMHKRYLLDPTHALEQRITANRVRMSQIQAHQRFVRRMACWNIPGLLLLCCISIGTYFHYAQYEAHIGKVSHAHAIRIFLVAIDVVALIASVVAAVSYESKSNQSLDTTTAFSWIIILLLQIIMMVYCATSVFAVTSVLPLSEQIHAMVVAVMLVSNAWIWTVQYAQVARANAHELLA